MHNEPYIHLFLCPFLWLLWFHFDTKSTLTCIIFLQVDILAASQGKVVCEMQVKEEHTNRGGTLHGGLTATLVDVVSTLAIMNSERGAPGVSVDMNIT